MYIRVSALLIEADRLLVTAHDYHGGRLLQLPGGKVNPGETIQQALARELKEELNLRVEVGELAFICAETRPDADEVMHLVLSARRTGGEPSIQKASTNADEVFYLPLEALRDHVLYPNVTEEILSLKESGTPSGKYLGACPPREWL